MSLKSAYPGVVLRPFDTPPGFSPLEMSEDEARVHNLYILHNSNGHKIFLSTVFCGDIYSGLITASPEDDCPSIFGFEFREDGRAKFDIYVKKYIKPAHVFVLLLLGLTFDDDLGFSAHEIAASVQL